MEGFAHGSRNENAAMTSDFVFKAMSVFQRKITGKATIPSSVMASMMKTICSRRTCKHISLTLANSRI